MSIEYDDKEKIPTLQQEYLIPATSNTNNTTYPSTTSYTPTNIDTALTNTNNGITTLNQGTIQSFNFVTGLAGWRIDSEGAVEFGSGKFRGDITGATGTFTGTVNINSLNVPDTTTANSVHIDSNGNTWWGANVASGISAANASVTAAGAAVFKNVQIGGSTLQYAATNNGIFSYGDGSDSGATCDGSTAVTGMTLAGSTYTMTRDVYFTTLVINNGVTLKPAGYRIFCNTSLSVDGTIQRNGNNGGNGISANGTNSSKGGGTGGTSLADGYLKGVDASGQGGAGLAVISGSANNGSPGTNKINSIGVNGVAGGDGVGATGGVAGTITASNVKLIANWHLSTMLDVSSSGSTVKFDGTASSGGGGGSISQSTGDSGAGGGGGGSAGGILAIYAKTLTVSVTGVISANGGTGGTGGNGIGGGGYAAGGGAGGSGGSLIIVYNALTNSGSITANGGTGGAAGTGNGSPFAGTTGLAGYVRQFQLSQ